MSIFSYTMGKFKDQRGAELIVSYRILIVEDEPKLLEHLNHAMKANDFSVFTCASFRELENLLTVPARFDVVILDRLLHGRDSAELIEKLKLSFQAKILILSAINTSAEKAALLNLGADDYIAKPFDGEELMARVCVLLRRDRAQLKFGNVALESENRTMVVEGKSISLTNKEFVLLRTLIQIPGRIYNKVFLYEQVWEMSPDVESNAVEMTVNKLRRRLVEAGATISIKNTRNAGYWIEE